MLIPAIPAAAAVNVGMEVVPNSTKVGYNEAFDVDILITDTVAQDMAAWTAYLLFNTTLLSVTGVDPVVTLPTGYGADDVPGFPKWDNTTGVVDHQSGTKVGDPYVNVSFNMMTVHFVSKAVPGTATLNFVAIDPTKQSSVLDPSAIDVLDWTQVVNGTVVIGVPQLTINISPWAYPGLAMGGCGIGYDIVWDMGVPVSYNFTVILPTDPLPNVTGWSWGEMLIVAAADIIPGWGFVNYTPVIGTLLPGNHYIDYYGQNLTIYPLVTQMNYLAMGTTCNFAPLAPEISVLPPSLSFECFEGINPAPDGLFMWNSGGGTLSWSAATDAGWLSVAPTSGNLTTSVTVENQTLVVSVNVTGLSADTYSGNVTITGASNVTIPVGLTVKPATAVDNCRDIIGSTDSGKPGETTELYAGETFDVYVNFTAPPTSPNDGFNSIGLTDVAPNGWDVTVNKSWCWIDGSPASALKVNAIGNKAEIMLAGPYDEGTTISVMYKVTVPTTATPGINTWEVCPDRVTSWLEYYFNEDGPYTNCISCDYEVVVTQPGDIVGETREVNSAELPDVDVRMHLVGPGYLRSDISTPLYVNTAWVTGTYWLTGNLTRFYELDISDGVMLPGADFTIGLTTQALLAAGYTFDFEGDYGLIPRACTMSYVLKCVNLWKIGSSANPEWNLSEWKAMDTANSWLYPS